MVFERFTNSLSWHWFFKEDSIITSLVEQGFDRKEAKELSFLIKSQYTGKVYGLLGGLALVISWGHWYEKMATHLPILRIRSYPYKFFMQLGLIGACIFLGDFVYTGHRHGANNFIGNRLRVNNLLYQRNKEDLIANFKVMDRKFTKQEIEELNFHRTMINRPNRRWIYNEHVYQPEQFLDIVTRTEKGQAPWQRPETIQKIKEQNPDKPNVQLEPYQVKKHLDSSGTKYNIKLAPQPGWASI